MARRHTRSDETRAAQAERFAAQPHGSILGILFLLALFVGGVALLQGQTSTTNPTPTAPGSGITTPSNAGQAVKQGDRLLAERRSIRYNAAKEARALHFATALADALHEFHITHKELAQALGVTIFAADYWTRGVDSSMPGAANPDKLCAWL